MHLICPQLLYADNGMAVAECAQQRYTEHDHDLPIAEAIAAGAARWLTDEVYGPPCPCPLCVAERTDPNYHGPIHKG